MLINNYYLINYMMCDKEKEYFFNYRPNEPIVNITDLSCGCDQDVYLIETNSHKYIMKKPKTEPIKITNEVFALKKLKEKDNGIPLPQILYHNEAILIESFIEGRHLKPNEESLKLYEELGKHVQAIHSVQLKGYGSINNQGEGSLLTEKEYLPFCLNPNDPSFQTNKHMKDLNIPEIIEKNTSLLNSETSVLLHGDLHCPNILTHKNVISGIIDFADIIAGAPEYDLAYYYINVVDMKSWDSFIKGYGKDFNTKKMFFYVFILGTWLLSSDEIANEESKSLHFKTSLNHLQ